MFIQSVHTSSAQKPEESTFLWERSRKVEFFSENELYVHNEI